MQLIAFVTLNGFNGRENEIRVENLRQINNNCHYSLSRVCVFKRM